MNSITGPDGRKLAAARPNCNQVVDPQVARAAVDAARCVTGYGAARGSCGGWSTAPGVYRAVGRPVAGKTGTTDDTRAAWFVGMTPSLAAASFIADPDNPYHVAGDGNAHKPIQAVSEVLRRGLQGTEVERFTPPTRRNGQRRLQRPLTAARRRTCRTAGPGWPRGDTRREPMTARVTCRCVYRFLLAPRWAALCLVMTLAAAGMVALGLWQLDRYHYRSAINARIEAASVAAPSPLTSVLSAPTGPAGTVGTLPPTSAGWLRVVVTGRYDQAHEILARGRTVNGRVGFEVITPLVLADGSSVLVDRGWVPPAEGGAGAAPSVPATPAG